MSKPLPNSPRRTLPNMCPYAEAASKLGREAHVEDGGVQHVGRPRCADLSYRVDYKLMVDNTIVQLIITQVWLW